MPEKSGMNAVLGADGAAAESVVAAVRAVRKEPA
jgi:hypothetical protein